MPPDLYRNKWKFVLYLPTLLLVLVARGASAQPYDFLAIYEPVSNSGQAHAVRLDASEGALLPDGGENHRLDRLVVKFKSDAISSSLLTSFSSIEFTVKISNAKPITLKVKPESISRLANGEALLMSWTGDGEKEPLSHVEISTRAIFSGKVLCAQEQVLLANGNTDLAPFAEAKLGKDQSPPDIQPDITDRLVKSQEDKRVAIKSDETKSNELIKEAILKDLVLLDVMTVRRLKANDDGPYILASFCRKSQIKSETWRAIAAPVESKEDPYKAYRFHQKDIDENPQRLKAAHKQVLARMVIDQLNDSFPSFNRAELDTEDPSWENALVYVGSQRKYAIIKSTGALMLMEEFSQDPKRISEIVDQDSEVSLSLDRAVCSQVPSGELWKAPWTFELEVPDRKDQSKTQRVKLEVDYRDGCSRKLLAKWSEYIKQRVTFRLIFRVPDREDIVVLKDSFEVYNIGLITTLPVFSEINSAVQGTSLRDVEATSSIPVSLAIPVGNDAKASSAVTFPFTVSVNTRTFPNLAEYFALAPSVSLIAGGGAKPPDATSEVQETSQGPSLALGVGVNMVRAFHFGYAWVPSDGRRYVLIGISVPELLPLFKGIH